MPYITLPTKVYHESQLVLVDKFLKSMLKGLKVEAKICKVSSHGLVQTAISGEDEKAALHYLAEEVGLCPAFLEHVEKFSIMKGYVASLIKRELYIDIGIVSPSNIYVTIPVERLQAQLVDGRKTAVKKMTDLFGLVRNLPLTVKICSVEKEKSRVEAMLSEQQLALYRSWIRSLLDRLIVLGASSNEVMLSLKKTRCNRDVVNIEPLGLFESAIVCKLGTDAVGLIPKIGRRLRNASFSIFNPRKIMAYSDSYQNF